MTRRHCVSRGGGPCRPEQGGSVRREGAGCPLWVACHGLWTVCGSGRPGAERLRTRLPSGAQPEMPIPPLTEHLLAFALVTGAAGAQGPGPHSSSTSACPAPAVCVCVAASELTRPSPLVPFTISGIASESRECVKRSEWRDRCEHSHLVAKEVSLNDSRIIPLFCG